MLSTNTLRYIGNTSTIKIYHIPDRRYPSEQDFIDGEERSIKRNPLLAQLMYYTKDIENFGTGLKRIALACDNAKVKLEFRLLKNGFTVVFYRPSEKLDMADKISGDQINVQINVQINTMEQQVLSLITENPNLTLDEVAGRISRSVKTAQRYLDSLRKKNIIRRVGAKKDPKKR